MTPEGRVKEAIDRLLKQYGAYAHKPVQNGMGKPALDYHICHHGRYLGVEAKAPGKHMSDRQVLTAYDIIKAGGSLFCIDSTSERDYEELERWLRDPQFRVVGAHWIHESDLYRKRVNEPRDDRSGDDEHAE